MSRAIQEIQTFHLQVGMVGSISVPAGAELLTAKLDQYDQPVVLTVGEFQGSYVQRQVLLIGSHMSLPDLELRWIGSFTRPGWGMETHLFEVLE